MKGLILVLILVALSASLEAAQFRQVEGGVFIVGDAEAGEADTPLHLEGQGWRSLVKSNSPYNLIQGSIGLWDVLLAQYQPHRTAVPQTVIVQDIPYSGNPLISINFIRVVQTSGQSAIPTIIEGGLGRSNVTIRLTSPPGQGFQYNIDIWGR